VVIEGDTWLGEACEVFPHAVIGSMPQDKKLKDGSAAGKLRIGSHNQIREFCTIHGGTDFGGGITRVGSRNMLLVGCHIGHDATVGDQVIFTNGAMAAGHTLIEDNVILGAMVGVHQFGRVGRYAMIGAGAMLSKDAPPFALVQGDRARLISLNLVGLRRAGFSTEQVTNLKKAYRHLFWRSDPMEERLASISGIVDQDEFVRCLVEFVEQSKRGLVMPRDKKGDRFSSVD
jgi:UDP-N-acetylglucosamine acyltransferase